MIAVKSYVGNHEIDGALGEGKVAVDVIAQDG